MEPLQTSVLEFLDMVRQPPELFQLPDTWAAFHECVGQLVGRCAAAAPAARDAVLRQLAAALPPADPFQAGRLAMVCGVLVEQGGDPALAADAVVQRLPGQLRAAHTYVQKCAADLGLDPGKASDGERLAKVVAERQNRVQVLQDLSMLVLPAVAMLARHRGARRAARQNRDLPERVAALRALDPEVSALAKMLDLVDDERLLVLHPGPDQGFRVATEAVHNNFHLFTLLQDALVGPPDKGKLPGPPLRSQVVAGARGEGPLSAGDTDAAVWSYYDWEGLRPDGTWSPSAEGHSIRGEGKPTDIPAFEGERVVLLGPLESPRSWTAGSFLPPHEALRSCVRVLETLPAAAVQDWVLRIRRAPRGT
jgi:hypothetical protein